MKKCKKQSGEPQIGKDIYNLTYNGQNTSHEYMYFVSLNQ